MEDVERQRREDIHAQLLAMGMNRERSDEAALKLGGGSIEIGVEFCFEAETRERVRSEAQKVAQKTGLRSQGAKAASLVGLSASPPADLLGNAAMGSRSSMALVVASITAEPDSDVEEAADEETAPLSARVEAARNSKQRRPSQAVPAVGKRGAAEDEERRLDGAPTMHTLYTSSCTRHARVTHTPRTQHACTMHTHHAHATEGKLYTYCEFVEEYEGEAGAVWARAGRGVDAARSTPKKPKVGAAGADGAVGGDARSGGGARAGAVGDARSPAPAPAPACAASAYASASASASAGGGGDSGGSSGGGLDKLEGKLMNHLGRLRHYLEMLEGLDATRAQDCAAASNTRVAASRI